MQRIYCPECESANAEDALVCSLCGHGLQGPQPNVAALSPTARKRRSRKLYIAAVGVVGLAGVGIIVVTNLIRPQHSLKVSTVPSEAVSAILERESAPSAPAVGLFDLFKSKEVIDQAKYERLYRAGKAMTAATAIGVNSVEFNRLLREFKAEFDVAVDQSVKNPWTPLLKSMMVAYQDAIAHYVQSASFWDQRLAIRDEETFNGKLPIFDLDYAESIRERFSVEYTTEKMNYTNKVFYGFPLELPQLIWGKAAEHIAAAEEIYLGRLP